MSRVLRSVTGYAVRISFSPAGAEDSAITFNARFPVNYQDDDTKEIMMERREEQRYLATLLTTQINSGDGPYRARRLVLVNDKPFDIA